MSQEKQSNHNLDEAVSGAGSRRRFLQGVSLPPPASLPVQSEHLPW